MTETGTRDALAALEEVVREQQARWTVPGIVVGVLRDGDVDIRAWGIGKLTTGEPLRADALVRVASISKVFTATLVMRLVEQGVLDLDTPVSVYLPDLRLTPANVQERVTLRLLLSHGSGILGDYFVDHGLGEDAPAKAIAHFGALPLLSEPGELWAYCNSGFHLAGRVVEVALGMPFDRAMREHLFAPLGLERTCFFAHDAIVWPHAIGHDQVAPGADEHRAAPQYYPRNRLPAGGVMTNAPELLRFAALHLGDGSVDGEPVLTAASLRAMREPQRAAANWAESWGIGWDLRTIGGQQVIAHGGSICGFQTQLTLVPEQRFALVVLTNSGRGSSANRAIEAHALDALCGLRPTPREPLTLAPERLAWFAGAWRQGDTTIRTDVAGDRIRLRMTAPWPGLEGGVPYPVHEYAPLSDRELLDVTTGGEGAGERIDVIAHPDGTPRYLRAHGRLYAPVAE